MEVDKNLVSKNSVSVFSRLPFYLALSFFCMVYSVLFIFASVFIAFSSDSGSQGQTRDFILGFSMIIAPLLSAVVGFILAYYKRRNTLLLPPLIVLGLAVVTLFLV